MKPGIFDQALASLRAEQDRISEAIASLEGFAGRANTNASQKPKRGRPPGSKNKLKKSAIQGSEASQ